MQFRYAILHELTDAQANFEQLQSAIGVPVLAAAPVTPFPGCVYYDSTLDQYGFWKAGAGSWTYI